MGGKVVVLKGDCETAVDVVNILDDGAVNDDEAGTVDVVDGFDDEAVTDVISWATVGEAVAVDCVRDDVVTEDNSCAIDDVVDDAADVVMVRVKDIGG